MIRGQRRGPGDPARPIGRKRRVGRVVGIGALTAILGVAAMAPQGVAADTSPFDVFQGATEAAPVRVGAGIPLEVFAKIGGSEAQVLQDPVARGAGMLVDTRITQLASLLIFGTVPAPPVALPSPTVAETIWSAGSPSPQTADASAVPAATSAPGQTSSSDAAVNVGAGQATAQAAEGPRGAGHAAYTDLALAPAGVKDAVRAREVVSDSAAAVTPEAVETSSTSVAEGVALLGGMVTIESIRSTARAASSGRPGGALADGSFEMGRVAALGKTAEITPDGIRIVDTSLPVPIRDAVNQQLQEQLAAVGATIRMVPAQRTLKEDGSFASVQSAGIHVRMAMSAAQPINPVVGDLSFNMTLGFATADASASRSADFGGAPTATIAEPGGPGAPATGGSAAGGTATPPVLPAGASASPSAGAALEPGIGAFPASRDAAGSGGGTGEGPGAGRDADGSVSSSSRLAASPASSTLGTSRLQRSTSSWWALAFVVLLAGFAAVVGLQALPRLVRPQGFQ
jgi:hypothetical protein